MTDALAIPRNTAPLPPFSGDDPTCPKCGYKGAGTTYLGYGVCVHDSGAGQIVTHGWDANERLHRECLRCRYAWDEATVGGGPTP